MSGDDGKAEPGAAGVSRSGVIQADEALEDPLMFTGWYAGAVVIDGQDHGASRVLQRRTPR